MKTNYKIIIDISADSETGFENSLNEAVKNIKSGNVSGMDGNDDEDYSFQVLKDEIQ